ncbi:MAG: PAS domain S-box protein [Pseudomonadota bacterium]
MTDSQTRPSDNPHMEGEDLASLRSLIRSILGSVPDAMIVIDDTGTVLAFSKAAETMFGYKSEDMSGQNVSMLMAGADREYHDRYIGNYLRSGERQIIGIGRIVQARLASGETIPVELKIGETMLNGRRLFTGYIRDVTDKQASAHRISEMQAELTNFSRLSAVGTMAAAMAHELNQPLTAVANYLEAARDLLDTPDEDAIHMVQDALDAAAKQSIRAGQIVRRLRDYVSRGELDLMPANLSGIVSDAASIAKIGINGPLARIITRVPDDLDPVLADRVQLRQVIVNLMKNATEALSKTEDPQIWVEAERTGEERVTLRVKDNGPGFSADALSSIFDPFKSSKPGGMGLGLSICQTIVEAHGSRLKLLSKPNESAVFEFNLAIAPQELTE